jgi:glycosyltransferase involved in cell wall biosynthesis
LRALHIGIKYWPYETGVIHHNDLKGKRGGGMMKYCDLLLNAFSGEVANTIIVQKLQGQKKAENIHGVESFRVTTFGNRSSRQVVANLKSFFIGARIIMKGNTDVIHGHLSAGIGVAWMLGRIFNKPVIGTPYSFVTVGNSFITNRLVRMVENTLYRRIDRLVFESEENRQKALTVRGLTFPNSVVIHTGITIPAQTGKEPAADGIIRLLYIGRLVKVKCLENLIMSVTFLDNRVRNKIHLDIVGEGERYDDLKKLILEQGLTDSIMLHGYVENNTGFFTDADIFLLTSHQEGLSISLLEAMSYGLACIVNDFGVPFSDLEVYTMKNNHPETIAEAITRFVDNPSLIRLYGENARRVLVDKFSVKRFAQSYQELYAGVINGKKSKK